MTLFCKEWEGPIRRFDMTVYIAKRSVKCE